MLVTLGSLPQTPLPLPKKGLELGGSANELAPIGCPQGTLMPSLCYANEGEAHWLGLQQVLGKTCAGRAEPTAFAPAFARPAAPRAPLLAGDALVGGSGPCLSGKCLAITRRSRPPPALFLGTARFFFFCR